MVEGSAISRLAFTASRAARRAAAIPAGFW
jgi:hypothetical protein